MDIICSKKQSVFREHSLRKTVSFKELIMSKDKYSSIFLRQVEAIMYVILQIFFATHMVLKIGECSVTGVLLFSASFVAEIFTWYLYLFPKC